MCNEADDSGQDIQHEAKSRLWRKERRRKKRNRDEKNISFPSLNSPEKCVATTGSSFN